ncbi:xylulokinase [Zavarzinella formosa]|uniref:xylulokinase n=1 Tax=Zavarzinella formosa TaxID=360055 RepID=UPI0002F4DEF5|nr:FGGY-family carbohydrate kinase [Zavarzinella formosa]
MSSLRTLSDRSLVTGWDFSTGAVKCLAFDLAGQVVAEVRFPTDLWTEGGVSEFNMLQLEGQARATTRGMAARLRELGRLQDWVAGGISATHHTAGRVDALGNQVRRMICWNDQTLAAYHAKGMERLGGPDVVKKLIGGPWAIRYSLSHLVKDEDTLNAADWKRTSRVLPHGPAAGGYLTGKFDVTSVSSAASTGIMDFRTNQWSREMLGSLGSAEHREMAWSSLPKIIQDMNEPIGPLSESIARDAGLPDGLRPLVFPTLDDQAAGLVGGGAVDAGQVAIILGNSAVVNSSASAAPQSGSLDAMKLNWGPYLWMRCYSNGAQFLDRVIGSKPDWESLEKAARAVPPGCNGVSVLPFVLSEPSVGVTAPRVQWFPQEPTDAGVRFRAALEAIAYLIALAVKEHESAGTKVTRITVSGGIAKSPLMGEILASVVNKPLERLQSSEGTALGAAVVALAGIENHNRRSQKIAEEYTVADAVTQLVRFGEPVAPVGEWTKTYATGLDGFRKKIG